MIGRRIRQLATCMSLYALGLQAQAAPFSDPLDVPAPVIQVVTRTQLAAVAKAGDRLVAVGLRGLIIVSDDGGRQWTQAKVPVSIELAGLQFVTPLKGWAVGHGGVVLHTQDGGLNWVKQLDGRQAAELLKAHFEALAKTGDAVAQRLLNDVQVNYEQGPEQALLGVWFEDELKGFVCGSFGTLLATHDGGKTWNSWMERVDTDQLPHLNAIRRLGRDIYIASERGTVFRLDRAAQRFVAQTTGYRGSFFGLVGNDDTVVAFGLRGTAYRTRDGGQHWEKMDTGARATINGGLVLADGRFMLVTQDGQALVGSGKADAFTPLQLQQRALFQDAVQVNPQSILLVGWSGPQLTPLN